MCGEAQTSSAPLAGAAAGTLTAESQHWKIISLTRYISNGGKYGYRKCVPVLINRNIERFFGYNIGMWRSHCQTICPVRVRQPGGSDLAYCDKKELRRTYPQRQQSC